MDQLEPEFVFIKRQFLSGVPLKLFEFKINDWGSKRVDYQKNVLQSTVLNPIVKKFPLLHSYQKSFLKLLMKTLEENGIEICEELYVEYAKMFAENGDSPSKYGHKIYCIQDDFNVILRENEAIVSQGSTGLVTWQAGKFLAEWCIRNKELFYRKHILELGCGLGLTGLFVTNLCKPRSYVFSDYHPKVLEQLRCNLKLNSLHRDDDSVIDSEPMAILVDATDVSVISIDWSDENTWKLSEHMFPDVIFAADVVYDLEQISNFLRILSHFLNTSETFLKEQSSLCGEESQHRNVVAYVACTVRNEETVGRFLDETETKGLLCKELTIQQWEGSFFFYDPLYRVKLYKITSST